MTGRDYEFAVAAYLRNCGFTEVSVTKASGDQGADLIAYKNGHKYAVQCKYYSKPVGNKAVQEVLAGKAYYGCDAAMVITNQTFTKSAVELAQKAGVFLHGNIDVRNAAPQKQRPNKDARSKAEHRGLHPVLCYLISCILLFLFWRATRMHIGVGKTLILSIVIAVVIRLLSRKKDSPPPPTPTYNRSVHWGVLSSGGAPILLPAGRYQVGVDIPIGAYRLTSHGAPCRLLLTADGQRTEHALEVNANWCLTAQHDTILEVSEPGVLIEKASVVHET